MASNELVSTSTDDSPFFLQLQDKYRQRLMQDTTLSKATELAAKEELLFMSNKSDEWKVPRVKANSCALHQWAKKASSMGPFTAAADEGSGIGSPDGSPMQNIMTELIKQATPQPKRKLPPLLQRLGWPYPPKTPPPSRIPTPAKTSKSVPPAKGAPPQEPEIDGTPKAGRGRYSNFKTQRKAQQSFKGAVKEGAKQAVKKTARNAAAEAVKGWLDFK